MALRLRDIIRRFHPEGIPWPGSLVYDAVSRTSIFTEHYQMVADDVGRYCQRGRVLDVGTGPGWLLLALQGSLPNVEIVGVDISAAMVRKAREHMAEAGFSGLIVIKEGAAAALPFADDSFDAVVSTGSMHHWKEPTAALNEIHRVLREGCYALLYDPVQNMPKAVAEDVRNKFGRVRLASLWLHSFEEPFYSPEELEQLARPTLFGEGRTHFVSALCCLVLKKESCATAG
jgi:ubiquinone/menaquinone biosynthesis C-methylase UbiE